MKYLAPIVIAFLPLANAAERQLQEEVAFSFYAMGDVPYAPWEERELARQIADLKSDTDPNALFTVHLGDIQKPSKTMCSVDHFDKIKNILADGPLPTFVLAGDNDYLECPNTQDAWDTYLDTFVQFENEWSGSTLNVDRRNRDRSVPGGREMFAFLEEGILFVSLALLNMKNRRPDDLFRARLAVSTSWLKTNLKKYKGDGIRGVVLLSHAEKSANLKPYLFNELKATFKEAGVDVPILYICGDAHRFNINRGLYWPQFNYVQVDRGACADPLLIEVSGAQPLTETDFRSQYLIGGGLFRIDRQSGRYMDNEFC